MKKQIEEKLKSTVAKKLLFANRLKVDEATVSAADQSKKQKST
jgi:hypothetical protein